MEHGPSLLFSPVSRHEQQKCSSLGRTPPYKTVEKLTLYQHEQTVSLATRSSQSAKLMEDVKNRRQIPAFGNWNCCDEVPIIAEYFESARGTGLIQAHLFEEDGEDLFKVVLPQHQQHQRKRKKGGGGRQGMKQYEKERRKSKPADEDLYEIPPELLYQAPRKKKVLRNLWIGCLGLNCIA